MRDSGEVFEDTFHVPSGHPFAPCIYGYGEGDTVHNLFYAALAGRKQVRAAAVDGMCTP